MILNLNKKLTVISPCYNEQGRIERSVKEMLVQLSSLPIIWEYIVVNDGSDDVTLDILKKIENDDNRLKVISYNTNRGRGYALRQGFKAAQGDIVITTEADSSWGPDIINRFLCEMEKDPELDIVIASTNLEGGGYKGVSFSRVFLSKFGNMLLRRAFDNKVTMATGMTRCYRRHVLDSLVLESDGKELHLEIVSKALILGYKIGEIPAYIEWKRNINDEKRKSKFKAKKLILSHLLFSFSEYPWLIFGLLGGTIFTLGIITGIISLYGQLRYLMLESGKAYVPLINPATVVLLLLFGLQILVFNFIAYQNKILQQDNVRTQRFLKKILDKLDGGK